MSRNSGDDSTIAVRLCVTHFERVASRRQCDSCPSKIENRSRLRLVDPDSGSVYHGTDSVVGQHQHAIDQLTASMTKALEERKEMEAQLMRLQHLVVGVDGDNGLRHRMEKHAQRVNLIEKWVWLATGGLLVAQVAMKKWL